MEDNCPVYRSRLCEKAKEKLGWDVIDLPPYSPDLNVLDEAVFGVFRTVLKEGLSRIRGRMSPAAFKKMANNAFSSPRAQEAAESACKSYRKHSGKCDAADGGYWES